MKKPITIETAFGPYLLSEILGEGGAGKVYGGTDSEGNEVAVKILSKDRATTDKRRRFKNEIAFLARNTHPNIVSVIDHGVATEASVDGPFYVMPKFATNLRKFMDAEFSADEKIKLFSGILDGVEAAHLTGAVHRDLKPENILIDTQKNVPAVADFGVASFTEDIVETLVETKPSQRLANFAYAAPEQRANGQEVGKTADVYALGLILNELFTGEVPYGTEYQAISSVNNEFGFLDDIVAQMIRQDPANRYSDISSVKSAISTHRQEYITRQKISQIDRTVIPEGEIDDPLAFEPVKIVGADYRGGVLELKLDRPVNAKWENALHNMGSYQSVYGIPPGAFNFQRDVVTVNVSDHDVQRVVDFFKEWLPKATARLKQTLEQEIAERKRLEAERLAREKAAHEQRLKVLQNLRY